MTSIYAAKLKILSIFGPAWIDHGITGTTRDERFSSRKTYFDVQTETEMKFKCPLEKCSQLFRH